MAYWFKRAMHQLAAPVVYDIGSNYGYYTLVAAPIARHVYAFEPVSRTYHVLERNIARNGLKNVRGLRLAVSDASERREIHLYSLSGNDSLFLRNLPTGHPARYIGRESVRAVSLDDIIPSENLLPPSLIKMDIEGAEVRALKGARRTITTHLPVLLIEHSEALLRDAECSSEILVNELKRYPYRLYRLSENVKDLNLYSLTGPNDATLGTIIAQPQGMSLE